MAGIGPPPKPAAERRRRNATPATVQLPAGTSKAKAPAFPLPPNGGDRGLAKELDQLELIIWAELWKTPLAAVWRRIGYLREVGQYTRWKARAEMGSIDAGKEARMLADRIGLTPQAMLRLRWEIPDDEVEKKRADKAKKAAAPRRTRLKAVDPKAVGGGT